MKASTGHILAFAVAVMVLSGSASTRPDGARLSSSEAIRSAKVAAVQEGIALSHYGRPTARFKDDQTWFVMFEAGGLFRSVGDFFAVHVDDRTGATRILEAGGRSARG